MISITDSTIDTLLGCESLDPVDKFKTGPFTIIQGQKTRKE